MNPDADSDWEYEYDDTEREDIYFTLDLTTHVPNAIQEKHYAKNGKLIAPAAAEKNALTAAHGEGDLNVIFDHPEANATPAAEAGQLQILDLHSEKPYVKFNNSFYSCYWFTDLGTQFWVTNPGVVDEPKYSGHVLDVVASSQTRLVAMPANLKRKRETIDPEPTPNRPRTQPMEIDDDGGASDVSDTDSKYQSVEYFQQDPEVPMVIPRQKIKDPHLEAQANFMERLSALKLKKGEADAHKIPMRVPVYYKGAPNADALRASHGVNLDDTPRRTPRVPPPSTVSRVSPIEDNEAGEGAPAADEGSPAVPTPLPKFVNRTRGGSRGGSRRGGVPSHAARRSNLGLELMGDQPGAVPKKRGRKSNAERARLATEAAAAEAEAEAEAVAGAGAEVVNEGGADSKPFALDPALVGEGQSPATPGEVPNEELSLVQESGRPPRKRRRNPAQMEEARRLEAERKADKAAARIAAHRR